MQPDPTTESLANVYTQVVCCKWEHVRPCGPVYSPSFVGSGQRRLVDDACACGCSPYDERCGGGEWWGVGDPPWWLVLEKEQETL